MDSLFPWLPSQILSLSLSSRKSRRSSSLSLLPEVSSCRRCQGSRESRIANRLSPVTDPLSFLSPEVALRCRCQGSRESRIASLPSRIRSRLHPSNERTAAAAAAMDDAATTLELAPSSFRCGMLCCWVLRWIWDGGGAAACDFRFHNDNTPIVALSTGWFNHKKRCLQNITIFGNGRKVNAMVVDECDSTIGCDVDHDFQPPCPNNAVVASKAVWKALCVPESDWGLLDIHWSDA
ncbi:hypothetical protein RIF29_15146 [Crotalaria pallida]|uniref:Uncharacterized protein n=1 Tax=Crotalaria pallida TaxID=3830 RepID=A0AAN9IED8_CROPI